MICHETFWKHHFFYQWNCSDVSGQNTKIQGKDQWFSDHNEWLFCNQNLE